VLVAERIGLVVVHTGLEAVAVLAEVAPVEVAVRIGLAEVAPAEEVVPVVVAPAGVAVRIGLAVVAPAGVVEVVEVEVVEVEVVGRPCSPQVFQGLVLRICCRT